MQNENARCDSFEARSTALANAVHTFLNNYGDHCGATPILSQQVTAAGLEDEHRQQMDECVASFSRILAISQVDKASSGSENHTVHQSAKETRNADRLLYALACVEAVQDAMAVVRKCSEEISQSPSYSEFTSNLCNFEYIAERALGLGVGNTPLMSYVVVERLHIVNLYIKQTFISCRALERPLYNSSTLLSHAAYLVQATQDKVLIPGLVSRASELVRNITREFSKMYELTFGLVVCPLKNLTFKANCDLHARTLEGTLSVVWNCLNFVLRFANRVGVLVYKKHEISLSLKRMASFWASFDKESQTPASVFKLCTLFISEMLYCRSILVCPAYNIPSKLPFEYAEVEKMQAIVFNSPCSGSQEQACVAVLDAQKMYFVNHIRETLNFCYTPLQDLVNASMVQDFIPKKRKCVITEDNSEDDKNTPSIKKKRGI